jgi:fucose permease
VDSSVKRPAALAGFALFILIGATVAMFGPTIPAFRATFHISAAAAGLLISGHFAGSLVGTLGPGFLPQRFRTPRRVSLVSTLGFALGCLVIGTAPVFPAAVAGAVIEGAGWGGIVIALNTLFASGFGTRSPAMLTLLNALYGVGAIIGPVAVGVLAGGSFRGPYLTAAAIALLLLPACLTLPGRAEERRDTGRASTGAALWPLAAFLVAFFLYGGLEGGIGAWEPTQLVATGLSPAAAATVTSLFWTSYTAGRLLVAPISLAVKPQWIVLAGLAAVTLLALSARVVEVTAASYTLCGLALGPCFPLAVAWSSRVLGASQRVTSFVISGDLLGGVVLSASLGQLVTLASAEALPLAFAAMAAGALCILLVAWRSGPPADAPDQVHA